MLCKLTNLATGSIFGDKYTIIEALWKFFKDNPIKTILFVCFLSVIYVGYPFVKNLRNFADEKRRSFILTEQEKESEYLNLSKKFHELGRNGNHSGLENIFADTIEYYGLKAIKRDALIKYFNKKRGKNGNNTIVDKQLDIGKIDESIEYFHDNNTITYDLYVIIGDSLKVIKYPTTMSFIKAGWIGEYKISKISQSKAKTVFEGNNRTLNTNGLQTGICRVNSAKLRNGFSLKAAEIKDINDEAVRIRENEKVINQKYNEALSKENHGLLIKSFKGSQYFVYNTQLDSTYQVKEIEIKILKKWYYIKTKGEYNGFVCANFIDKE